MMPARRASARRPMLARLILTLVAITALAGSAHAQAPGPSDTERAAARDMGEKAVAAYQAGDYEKAYDLFTRAHAIVGLTTTGLYLARCLVKLDRFVEASERYVEIARIALPDDAQPLHVEAKATAQKEREALLPRIPKLRIALDEPDAADVEVTLDGVEVPKALLGVSRPVDPGEHVVAAVRGDIRREERVVLAEGQSRDITLAVKITANREPQPPRPETPNGDDDSDLLQTLGWIAIGVGGAGLVVGAVTGGLAIDKRSSLDKACTDKQCTPEFHPDVDSYQTLRIVSGAGLIAGGVLAAAGIVLLIVAPDAPTEASVSLRVSPASLAIRGTF